MNIVFASDDNYVGLLAASLLSLLEHNVDVDELNIYVFDDNISQNNKDKLAGIAAPFKCSITYMRVPTTQELTGIYFKTQRWSSTMLLRLFVGSLLPPDVKRIIFLDCDVLVLDSLRELWEMDLTGCCIGGVQECSGDARKKNLGLVPSANYINAGVEIIDLNALRESDAEQRYIAFLKESNGYVPEVEQGTVNACISERIKLIHPRWNVHTTFYMFDYDTQRKIKKPTVYPTRAEVQEALDNPAVVHFSGCCFSDTRPWQDKECAHPWAKAFMEYKARTPWNDPLYMQDNRSRFKRICNWAYRKLPKPIYTFTAGIGYQYLIPWKEGREIKKVRQSSIG